MSLKKFSVYSLVVFFAMFCFMLCGFSFLKKTKVEAPVHVVSEYSTVQNNLWCVTFQLVWNELSDKLVKGPVNFVGGNPQIVDELNKKLYTSDILSEKSYYTTFGKVSKKLKRQIEKNIKKKFNEKSDLLDMVNWNVKNSYLFYSILKKNFTFLVPFDRLANASFNSSKEVVKYFGISENSDKKLRDNVTVLFYNSPDEYAVKLNTNEKENVILFRTDNKSTFVENFDYVISNSNEDTFSKKDTLLIPDMDVNKTITYNELTGRQIENTNYVISQALQTIQFKLDNKGGSLKSEAIITVMKTSLMPEVEEPRHFLFDKPFVLFLIEDGKDKPYYAMNVENTDFLVTVK